MVKHETFAINESPMSEFGGRFYIGCSSAINVNNAGAYMGVEVDGNVALGRRFFSTLSSARKGFAQFRNDIEADLPDHWLVIVEVFPQQKGSGRLVHSVFDEHNAGAYRSPVVPAYEWRGVDAPSETLPEHPDTGTW